MNFTILNEWKPSIKLFLLMLLFPVALQAQYQWKNKRDIPLLGTGLSMMVSARIIENNTNSLTNAQIAELPPAKGIDAWLNPSSYSEGPKVFSDVLVYSEVAASMLLLSVKAPDKQRFIGLMMAVEGYLINQGLTDLTKLAFLRPRPYVSSTQDLYDKNIVDARLSFYSGHTSNASYWSFMTTSILHEWGVFNRNWTWWAASSLPVIMGYARMKAGKHYFSDVLVGSVMGSAVGLLIPHLHKEKQFNRNPEISYQFYQSGKIGMFIHL